MKSDKDILKNLFSKKVVGFRSMKDLTQEAMSEQLEIARRSYADLESKKSCPSVKTFMRFWVQQKDEEMLHFLQEYRAALSKEKRE